MKLRRISDLHNLETVAKDCNDFITNMKIKNLYEAVNPEDLDQEPCDNSWSKGLTGWKLFLMRCILNLWEWLSACFG